jgi:hypothetical protein
MPNPAERLKFVELQSLLSLNAEVAERQTSVAAAIRPAMSSK